MRLVRPETVRLHVHSAHPAEISQPDRVGAADSVRVLRAPHSVRDRRAVCS